MSKIIPYCSTCEKEIETFTVEDDILNMRTLFHCECHGEKVKQQLFIEDKQAIIEAAGDVEKIVVDMTDPHSPRAVEG